MNTARSTDLHLRGQVPVDTVYLSDAAVLQHLVGLVQYQQLRQQTIIRIAINITNHATIRQDK